MDLVEVKGFLEGAPDGGVPRYLVEFGEGLHEVQVGVGALETDHFDFVPWVPWSQGGPVGFRMFKPSAVLGIVKMPLQIVVEGQGVIQGSGIAAGAVVFHQRVDHEGLSVEELRVMDRPAFKVGLPKVAAVLAIKEVIDEKTVTVTGRREIIAGGVAIAAVVSMSERPDHARLADQLFFPGLASALEIIGEQITAVLPVESGVVPIGEYLLPELSLELAGVLGQWTLCRTFRRGQVESANWHDQGEGDPRPSGDG